MKKILLFFLVIVSFNSFGQVPTGYQVRKVNERIQGAFMVDSFFNLPRYYDTTAANLHKRSDTCGALFFSYSDRTIWVRDCTPKKWVRVSGTPGGSTKQVQYNNAGAFGGGAGFEYGNTNNNVLITAQATTDVPLNVKGASAQTANLQNWSSSAGTGDLGNMNKDGYLQAIRGGFGGTPTYPLHIYGGSDGTASGPLYITGNTGTIGAGFTLDAAAQGGIIWSFFSSGSGASTPAGAWGVYASSLSGFRLSQKSSSEFSIGQNFFDYSAMLNVQSYSTSIDAARLRGFEDGDAILGLWADEGDDAADKWFIASNKTSNDLTFKNNTTENFAIISTGGVRMPEIAAPSTPASATAVIYPKSDGLWYGKDDAGVETKLSNTLSGLIQSKGMTLESPGAAESFGMWQTQVAITVSSIKAVLVGSASPSVTINIAFGTDRTSGTNVFSSGTAITNTTTGQTLNSGFNDATIPAGSFIWFITTAQSGTVTQIELTINYTQD